MDKKHICCFCGTPSNDYVDGLKGCICHSCIDIVRENKELSNVSKIMKSSNILRPHEIKSNLDKYIIGQDKAKKKLSVEVYNHYKRIFTPNTTLPKNNILLIGPTGSGKTYLLQKLSEILDVPIAFSDANDLTANGYTGKDVDVILKSLIDKSNGDIEKAQKGIIYIDEIDKLAQNNNGKDIGTTAVQQSLLTILEGCDYYFDKKNIASEYPASINTKNILFICGGAFDGLEDIIKSRLNKKQSIGFNINNTNSSKDNISSNVMNNLEIRDLAKYGFIEEFIGRLSSITILEKLTEADMKDILVKPKNSIIKQYQELFKIDDVELNFSDDALSYIAEKASKQNTGARGLKNIISDTMTDLMFEIPQQDIKQIEITKDFLERRACE